MVLYGVQNSCRILPLLFLILILGYADMCVIEWEGGVLAGDGRDGVGIVARG